MRPPSVAAPTADLRGKCVASFGDAQKLRRDGKLMAARSELLKCAQSGCPQIVTAKCVPWLSEVDAALPSVVVLARDLQRRDTTAVRVIIDGEVRREQLDGRAIPVDPGAHQFRFEHVGAPPVEQHVVLVEAQKNRLVQVDFAAQREHAPLPPAPTPAGPVAPPATSLPRSDEQLPTSTILAIAGFSLGGVGLVVGAITGAVSLANGAELADKCPAAVCSEELRAEYDDGVMLAHVATAAFVVGGVGVAFGVASLLATDEADESGAGRVEIRLGPAGASLGLQF